ncbi:DUF1707 SHOCT-like domain-containing protein [Streptomyces oceani]|uniref:DUF1707 domain-containing protein n=1 Tax=Streptomyces oceani TaxID=1075402 RepID=A0A1E7KP01_9ACTN|nr:DUF1707 domain-containing protein [Streptomyces oceani]OEV05616.1 hypothetical protein AN216_02595 [Streptomyces oceani]
MPSVPENVPPRVTDMDRNTAVERLQDAFAEGHLVQEEMDTRLHLALTATTHGELSSALASLPSKEDGRTVEVNPIGGQVKRRGRWHAPRTFKVASRMAKVKLDYSRAYIDHPVLDVELNLEYGWARVILPADATVDYEGLQARWKQPVHRPSRHGGSNGPRIRITGNMGYGRLTIKHRRS